MHLAVNVVVFRTEDGLCLFDPLPRRPLDLGGRTAGMKKLRMFFSDEHGLLAYIEQYGGTEAVRHIVLTHHHPDHCCALFCAFGERRKVFPNATVWTPCETELNRYSDAYIPVSQRYESRPASEFGAIRMYTTNVHARRHTTYLLDAEDCKVVVWGDMMPTALHLRSKFSRVHLRCEPPPFIFQLARKSAKNNWIMDFLPGPLLQSYAVSPKRWNPAPAKTLKRAIFLGFIEIAVALRALMYVSTALLSLIADTLSRFSFGGLRYYACGVKDEAVIDYLQRPGISLICKVQTTDAPAISKGF
ncbi:MAG: MBL fold metallo-hydrolase [Planctomycetota bacterium]|nr:MBL fold metallo-hydrolase [Planctomycetota bacterium]